LATSNVNSLVDAVFVLSVKTFHDRIRHIESELAQHGIRFEWIFEHDADELTPQQIDAVFAPSDLKRGHQSLVLKHIETWRRCVERGYRRVLVFEDDAVLARDFDTVFAQAMKEADALDHPYFIYLGCGDNKYVAEAARSPTMLVEPDQALPATDATVLDRRAAQLRLEYIARHKVTRPADWLMREADAAMGVAHYWLRSPVVEQGSMSGRFMSVLDEKRTDRGRGWAWLRFRWDRWRRRTLGSTRPDEARVDVGAARTIVRRDMWLVGIGRFAAALTAIGAFIVTGLASAAAGFMVIALLAAPSRWQRLKHAFWQPLGQAALLMMLLLTLAMLWSPLEGKPLLREWVTWRQFAWLLCALALFDTPRAKYWFAALFAGAAALTACVVIGLWSLDIVRSPNPDLAHVLFRNHVTQGMAQASGALLSLILAVRWEATRMERVFWAGCGLLLIAGVAITAARSGYIVLAVVGMVALFALLTGRIGRFGMMGLAAGLVVLAALSPRVVDRFDRALTEVRTAPESARLSSMGIRVVIWRNTLELIREAPLLGHGLGSFEREYKRVAARSGSGWRATPSSDPHNQYLLFAAETGVLGLAAFTWFLVAAVRQPVRGAYRVIGLALLLAWCITSLFSSHFQAFNEGHMIMLFLGVFLSREAAPHALSVASTTASTSS
jgi:O-antigen ligase/GR25 family glycosyltransferase involved in LPS biosynthesis